MAWIYVLIMLFSLCAVIILLSALGRDSSRRQRLEPAREEQRARRSSDYESEESEPYATRRSEGRTRRSVAMLQDPAAFAVMPEETGKRAKRRSFLGLKIICTLVWLLAAAALIVYLFF